MSINGGTRAGAVSERVEDDMKITKLMHRLGKRLAGREQPETLNWPAIQTWIGENLRIRQRSVGYNVANCANSASFPPVVMELHRQANACGQEQITASFGPAGRVFDPLFSKTWNGVALAPDLRLLFGSGDRMRIQI